MEKRSTRSDKYQFLILEIAYSHDMMETFSNDHSIYKRLNPYHYDERIADLQDELKEEFWKIVGSALTERQKAVITLYADGYTQMEIAKMLGVNQSSITKSLNGNVDYKNGKRIYGGTKKKILKLVENNQKIKDIFKKISDLRNENWF